MKALTVAAWLGIVGTLLQLAALALVVAADDYPRAFWLYVLGAFLGSWSWRIWKAVKLEASR